MNQDGNGTQTHTYLVRWERVIEASSPLEAADRALTRIRAGLDTVFEVDAALIDPEP